MINFRIQHFFKYLFIFGSICLLLFNANAQQKRKPNIIYILADDLGYGDIGCYGQQKVATPNIDTLAKNGMRFTQFYAGTTVCAPSRASLMTGLQTGHSPIRGNVGTKPEGQFPMPDSIQTIANVLQNNGYQTGAFGKWGMGFITTSGDPNKKGFDQFYGYNCQSLAHNYYPDHLWDNHNRIEFPENKTSNAVYSADIIQQHALAFLQKTDKDKPYFLYLTYTLPHGDVISPKDSIYNFYVSKFAEKPVAEKKKNDGEVHRYEPYPHAAFAAMVTRLDAYVGEVVKAIKARGEENNTLIIFTSDNGPHRENGGDPEFFNSNGGLRGIKRDMYEGGIRVPFIASWKNTIPASVTNPDNFAFWDMFPTFQQMAGLPVSKKVDGISILPALTGKKQIPHAFLYWEFHEGGGKQAVRWGKYKAVKLNVSTSSPAPLELYDLEKDPSEKNNIAAGNSAVVKQMEKFIQESHVSDANWPLLLSEKRL